MITLTAIGTIHTSYDPAFAPHQPPEGGEATLVLDASLAPALVDLESFSYVYVLYHLDRQDHPVSNVVKPPWARGRQVGLFASRSPARPNPVGLSVVRLKKVEGNVVTTSALDVFDGTPLIDIKPYIRSLDSKPDADNGWISALEGGDHILDHLRGVPHDHGHDHGHGH